jgi:hypothetical protein
MWVAVGASLGDSHRLGNARADGDGNAIAVAAVAERDPADP